jgi:hypothetical protein
MFRYLTRDDRGRPARVHAIWVPPPREGRDGVLSFVSRLWCALPRSTTLPLLLLIGAPVTYAALALIFGPFFVALTTFSPIASTLILLAIWIVLWAARAFSYHARTTRLSLIESGRCPSCLYEMGEAIEDDASGMATCPECGSAWDRRPRTRETITISRDAMRLGPER